MVVFFLGCIQVLVGSVHNVVALVLALEDFPKGRLDLT